MQTQTIVGTTMWVSTLYPLYIMYLIIHFIKHTLHWRCIYFHLQFCISVLKTCRLQFIMFHNLQLSNYNITTSHCSVVGYCISFSGSTGTYGCDQIFISMTIGHPQLVIDHWPCKDVYYVSCTDFNLFLHSFTA